MVSSLTTTTTNARTSLVNGSSALKTHTAPTTSFQAQEATLSTEPVKVAQTAPSTPITGSCGDWMNQAGVTDHANAHILIMRESGCRPTARNASSGAYGIPQSLPASKIAHCGDEPVCQIKWMQDYIIRRYGSWSNAVAHSNTKGWY